MNKDITNYIKRQKSPQKQICQKIRKLILETFPGADEEMKWGAIVFAGGKFCSGKRGFFASRKFHCGGLS